MTSTSGGASIRGSLFTQPDPAGHRQVVRSRAAGGIITSPGWFAVEG